MGDLRGAGSAQEALTLGIDTSSRRSYVALCRNGVSLGTAAGEELGSAEILSSLIRDLCSRQSVELGELQRIVVCLGPGSYTGIRTGLASSNGLALALGIPVFGISGLVARLRPYLKKQDGGGLLLSYQSASKAEYYWSLLRGETKADNSWKLRVLRPLTFSKIELFEQDVQTFLHEQDLDSSTLIRARVDPEHIALTESPAASLGWAQSFITCAEPEYQLSDARTSLQPLYGKGANAKTLLERGIKKHDGRKELR